jgi:hypothetical protein
MLLKAAQSGCGQDALCVAVSEGLQAVSMLVDEYARCEFADQTSL